MFLTRASPGNARTWRGVQIDASLHQKNVQSIVTQKIRDDNTHRQPRYPFEPALRALEAADKVTSLNEIDIVADADTLTQLLAIIMGNSATSRVKEPFRLELKTVRNTLFIHPSQKPGSSQTGPLNKKTRHDPSLSVPDWAAGVLGHIGTRKAKLPYSGGNYRLVRYRFGNVVLVVRVKVDFVYELRKDSPRANVDPLRDVQPEFLPHQEGNIKQIWKTTVKKSGLGTRPANAGITSVRYPWQDQKVRMRALLPQLWFSRTPFVVDCQVRYPDLTVEKASLVNSRQYYTWYERGHQNSLRRLAGLLKHLQTRTEQLGGDVVLIADPNQVCFVLLTPVIGLQALPEDLVMKFWGPGADIEMEEGDGDGEEPSEMARDSTPEEAHSDLTDLSDTPSLPAGSDVANVGHPQTEQSQPGTVQASGQHLQETVLDSVKMVEDWNDAVESPVRQSVEDFSPTGYQGGNEATPASHNAEQASFDGNRSLSQGNSSSQGSVMVGESAQESGAQDSDAVLNSLAVQMNQPGVMRESHENLTVVARAADVEVLGGQHSLLMADRHQTGGMHESSDDEWPPRPPAHLHGRITNRAPDLPQPPHAHGDMNLRSTGSGSLVPPAKTPPGPSDTNLSPDLPEPRHARGDMDPSSNGSESSVPAAQTPPGPYDNDLDSESHIVPRGSRNRDDQQAYSDEEEGEEEDEEDEENEEMEQDDEVEED